MRVTGVDLHAARLITGITTLVLCSVLPSGLRAAPPASISSIPQGTVIPVRLNDDLNSVHSRVGDRFSATVASEKHGYSNYRGVQFEGVVAGVSVKDGTKPGTIRLKFDKVRGPHGKVIKFDGVGAPLNGDNFDLDMAPYRVKNPRLTGQFVGSTYKPMGGRKGKDILLKHGDTIAVIAR